MPEIVWPNCLPSAWTVVLYEVMIGSASPWVDRQRDEAGHVLAVEQLAQHVGHVERRSRRDRLADLRRIRLRRAALAELERDGHRARARVVDVEVARLHQGAARLGDPGQHHRLDGRRRWRRRARDDEGAASWSARGRRRLGHRQDHGEGVRPGPGMGHRPAGAGRAVAEVPLVARGVRGRRGQGHRLAGLRLALIEAADVDAGCTAGGEVRRDRRRRWRRRATTTVLVDASTPRRRARTGSRSRPSTPRAEPRRSPRPRRRASRSSRSTRGRAVAEGPE